MGRKRPRASGQERPRVPAWSRLSTVLGPVWATSLVQCRKFKALRLKAKEKEGKDISAEMKELCPKLRFKVFSAQDARDSSSIKLTEKFHVQGYMTVPDANKVETMRFFKLSEESLSE